MCTHCPFPEQSKSLWIPEYVYVHFLINIWCSFIAEVIQPPPKEPKKKALVIDLTLSDSEDEAEAPVKTNATNKPDSSNQTVNSLSGTGLHSGQ